MMKVISTYAESKKLLTKDRTILAGEISNATNGEVICTSVEQIISHSVFETIYSTVKNMVIKALYELEKTYGTLDNLGIEIVDSEPNEKNNDALNKAVFNINAPELNIEKKESWYTKVGWRIIVPIITAIIGAVVAAIIIKNYGI